MTVLMTGQCAQCGVKSAPCCKRDSVRPALATRNIEKVKKRKNLKSCKRWLYYICNYCCCLAVFFKQAHCNLVEVCNGTRINSLIALFINYNFNFRIRLKNCCNLDKTSEPQTITKSTCIIMVILSRI